MRQPDKNRFLKAARHVESEEISFQENEVDLGYIRHFLGPSVPPVRSYQLPVASCLELNRLCGNDLVFLGFGWGLGRKNVVGPDGRLHYVDGTMKTPRDLKHINCPSLDPIRRRMDEICAAVENTGLGIIYAAQHWPFLVACAIGYQDYYLALADNPGFIREFQKRVRDYCLHEMELVLGYPVDVVQLAAVFCMKTGAMISRDLIEEFEFPALREMAGRAGAKGCVVSLHIDGDVRAFIPDFIGLGINVLNPIEPCGGQDIYEIKRLFGDRIALHGNIDVGSVLVNGTPQEVSRSVAEHIGRLAAGGGYICASSHDIGDNVPIENFCAMRDTVLNFRFRRLGRESA
jgi:hypothetical protein